MTSRYVVSYYPISELTIYYVYKRDSSNFKVYFQIKSFPYHSKKTAS
ncbi:BgTH12-07621 [Blumeria graminis f. sp. triticale]|uniref:BgTH12-07621 n=1 Tax=Blumeria graminis f. sp. triticale TaxID=1689686 RepID=A0A9W4DEQ6_BLUGR|nr:BgTH12-07621 [Blumeria graminis f. sp. triticale]